jgi:hypothetical protein
VRWLPRDGHLPSGRSAPRRDAQLRIAGPVLESDRDVGAGRRLDEGRACGAQWIAGILLVARHEDHDVHRLQAARRMERLQGGDHDDVSPFHVDDARSTRAALVDALELLERRVALEDGVQMSDQQDARSAAAMLGDEMPRTLERRAVGPARREADGLELPPEDAADFADPFEILCAAVDVHDALEQRQRFGVVCVDEVHERALVRRRLRRRLHERQPENERRHEGGRQGNGIDHGSAPPS